MEEDLLEPKAYPHPLVGRKLSQLSKEPSE